MKHRMDIVITGYYYTDPSTYSDTLEVTPSMAANMDEVDLNGNSIPLEEFGADLEYKVVHSEDCECFKNT